MKTGKLSKKQIEKRWLACLKKEYPHMQKEERLKVLFELFPFLAFGKVGVDKCT